MRTVSTLGLADALVAQEAGQQCARDQGIAVSIAVVDRSGGLIAQHTMDDTQPAGADVAAAKARAAAVFRRPTVSFEQAALSQNKPSIMLLTLAVDRALPVQGGVPVRRGDEVVGAIGVSGGSGAQDAEVAAYAAEAIAAASATSTR